MLGCGLLHSPKGINSGVVGGEDNFLSVIGSAENRCPRQKGVRKRDLQSALKTQKIGSEK